eukprot:TRINITY_DN25320_c0_g1_i1.p6 TRINITY_DN25320_c0_g1~~TRINITY_DN25320_c0_g1_i1.p6  ORF type:complete len:106 (-),score=2.97 TRINITY_DN25320_c0_g1_i1:529-846(-)
MVLAAEARLAQPRRPPAEPKAASVVQGSSECSTGGGDADPCTQSVGSGTDGDAASSAARSMAAGGVGGAVLWYGTGPARRPTGGESVGVLGAGDTQVSVPCAAWT